MGLFSGMNTKAIIGALGAAGSALVVAQEDGILTGTEIGMVVGAFLAGFGLTWAIPFAYFKAAKAVTATFVALAGSVAVALENDGAISGDEWYVLIGIIATAVAAYSAPNAPSSLVGGVKKA
jgi:hypothetical protein